MYSTYINYDIFTGGAPVEDTPPLNEILQFNAANHTWSEVGQMKETRVYHAVAVLDDVSKLCP